MIEFRFTLSVDDTVSDGLPALDDTVTEGIPTLVDTVDDGPPTLEDELVEFCAFWHDINILDDKTNDNKILNLFFINVVLRNIP